MDILNNKFIQDVRSIDNLAENILEIIIPLKFSELILCLLPIKIKCL